MPPLVSILIPAYNAEKWIAQTIRSAVSQTWAPKEIIIVDDGSTDRTAKIASQFESAAVRIVRQDNQGAAAARNKAFSLCRGDFIQWLDADDLLAPDKIANQMEVVNSGAGQRTLLSSAWGYFMYRPAEAEFTPNALWGDLSPVEFMVRKLGQKIFMQTAVWLVSRRLTEAAGPWNTNLVVDDDGEYFCRVLLASDGIRFVPQSKVYYRQVGTRSLSHVGRSSRKLESVWRSMQLHMSYLRSLEDSERVRESCIKYLQNYLVMFYPDRLDIVQQIEQAAQELGGRLRSPQLTWKYAWIKSVCGWDVAKRAQLVFPDMKWSLAREWDRVCFLVQSRGSDDPTHSLKGVGSSEPVLNSGAGMRQSGLRNSDSMDRPLISYVLLSYNQESFIGAAVEGALSQTYSPLEIVIQDDNSTDGSLDIVKQMVAQYRGPHSVRCLRNSVNLGIAKNLSRAMEECRGNLIVVAAGDDISAPERTETIFEAWEQSGRQATALFSCYTLIAADGSEQGIKGTCGDLDDPRLSWELHGELLSFLSTRVPMIHGCSAAYSPELMNEFGSVWGDLEDMVLCFRTLAVGKLVYINRPLIKYRRHGENASFFQGGEVIHSFENREKRLLRGNRMTVNTFENLLADIETLHKSGNISFDDYSRLKAEARRVQRPFDIEWKMMKGSTLDRLGVLAKTAISGDFRGFLRAAPRGLPKGLYRRLYLLREKYRSIKQGGGQPLPNSVIVR